MRINNGIFVVVQSNTTSYSPEMFTEFADPPEQGTLLLKEGVHVTCGDHCRWKAATNTTNLRMVVVESQETEHDGNLVQVVILDTGYNTDNPPYTLWLPEHYSLYDQVGLGVSTGGDFYLLLGNDTHYSVFLTSLSSVQPLLLH